MKKKFRKRPVVVNAIQYTEYDAKQIIDRVSDSFYGHMAHKVTDEEGCVYRTGKLRIETRHDTLLVSPGDWIITGVGGETYPVKPEIFEQIYEPVEEE